MEPVNILHFSDRGELREWLSINCRTARECWVVCRRGRNVPDGTLAYLDVVEEALCFGWIDSTVKSHGGITLQRLTPRKKGSIWSELNKERCRRLIRLELMTEHGRKVLPDMEASGFNIDGDILAALQEEAIVWENFRKFPPLYQRMRIDTIQIKRDTPLFDKRLEKLIDNTRHNIMYGDWNDNRKLLETHDGTEH